MPRINYRTSDGWLRTTRPRATKKTPANICPKCGATLYVAPDGKTIYCDAIHIIK